MPKTSSKNIRTKASVETQISPQEFQTILRGLQLGPITLTKFSGAILDFDAFVEPGRILKQDTDLSAGYQGAGKQGDELVFAVTQHLTVRIIDGDEPAAELSCTFLLIYLSKEEWTPSFFEVFKNSALLLQILPFGREWFYNQSLRMGIPPVVLPLIQIPGTAPTEHKPTATVKKRKL